MGVRASLTPHFFSFQVISCSINGSWGGRLSLWMCNQHSYRVQDKRGPDVGSKYQGIAFLNVSSQSVNWVFDVRLLLLEHSSENSGMGRMWRGYEKLSWPQETSWKLSDTWRKDYRHYSKYLLNGVFPGGLTPLWLPVVTDPVLGVL